MRRMMIIAGLACILGSATTPTQTALATDPLTGMEALQAIYGNSPPSPAQRALLADMAILAEEFARSGISNEVRAKILEDLVKVRKAFMGLSDTLLGPIMIFIILPDGNYGGGGASLEMADAQGSCAYPPCGEPSPSGGSSSGGDSDPESDPDPEIDTGMGFDDDYGAPNSCVPPVVWNIQNGDLWNGLINEHQGTEGVNYYSSVERHVHMWDGGWNDPFGTYVATSKVSFQDGKIVNVMVQIYGVNFLAEKDQSGLPLIEEFRQLLGQESPPMCYVTP